MNDDVPAFSPDPGDWSGAVPPAGKGACQTLGCSGLQVCRGQCRGCYWRAYQHKRKHEQDVLTAFMRTQSCVNPGCDGVRFCKGRCQACYYTAYRLQKHEVRALCSVPQCKRRPLVGSVCRHHHDARHGTTKPARSAAAKSRKRAREEPPEALSDRPSMKKARPAAD